MHFASATFLLNRRVSMLHPTYGTRGLLSRWPRTAQVLWLALLLDCRRLLLMTQGSTIVAAARAGSSRSRAILRSRLLGVTIFTTFSLFFFFWKLELVSIDSLSSTTQLAYRRAQVGVKVRVGIRIQRRIHTCGSANHVLRALRR